MRYFLLGFLLVMSFVQAYADDASMVTVPLVPATVSENTNIFNKISQAVSKKPAPKPANLKALSGLGGANISDPLVPVTYKAASSPVNHPDAPRAVDPEITQQTDGAFHGAEDNLSLYVTQIQCQATGINTSSCNNQGTTNTSSGVISNVNKFLLNSVTSSLGIGVQVHF
jgi:hypothetical protein